jgi:type IV secretion system protein TrbL
MSLVLASLALFGLGIFGPGIASGLVAGAPQLGQAQRSATALGAGGTMYLGGAGAAGLLAVWLRGRTGAVRAGTAMGSAASTAYALGQEGAGSSSVGAGIGGMASAGGRCRAVAMLAALVLARPPRPAAGRVQRHGRT